MHKYTTKPPSVNQDDILPERLARILDDANTLFVDASWLQIQAAQIFLDLKQIGGKDPSAASNAAFCDALKTAEQLDLLAVTIDSEVDYLVDCLNEVTDRDLATTLAA